LARECKAGDELVPRGMVKDVFELDERLQPAGLGNNRTMTLSPLLP
jgi:hypothetical protein